MRNSCKRLVDYIAGRYSFGAEIGIGHFPDVALALAERGLRVFATDIKPFLHDGVKVVVDNITQPDVSLYTGVSLIYSLRPPLELVPYMRRLAKVIAADLVIKPLASEYPGGQLISGGNTTFFLWNNP